MRSLNEENNKKKRNRCKLMIKLERIIEKSLYLKLMKVFINKDNLNPKKFRKFNLYKHSKHSYDRGIFLAED